MTTNRNIHRFNQDFKTLRKQALENYRLTGKLFEDDEFPATNESLYAEKSNANEMMQKDPYFCKWRRPNEICDNPQFFKNGRSTHDVNQGHCKDCWFIAAITNLTFKKKLFTRVVKGDNTFKSNLYAGIFHFRFFQYGQWVDIVIDDRLPTFVKSDDKIKLSYAFSKEKDEFWSALLEKAFAKLHGSYEALGKMGTFCEAAEDLTGGVSQKFCAKRELCSLCQQNSIYDSIDFCQLEKCFQMGNLMSCFIRKTKEQNLKTEEKLVRGHSFAIINILQTVNDNQLIKLKNPWGSFEWNGPWSDKSDEWKTCSEDIKKELKFQDANDGEFIMSYKDFQTHFDVVEICYLKLPSPLQEFKHQDSCFLVVAQKHPRIQSNCDQKIHLTFKIDLSMLDNIENFRKRLELAVENSTIQLYSCDNGSTKKNRCGCLPRNRYQLKCSQIQSCQLISDGHQFYIRFYICCRHLKERMRCISLHANVLKDSNHMKLILCK